MSQPEIEQLDGVAFGEKQVCGFDVAVDDARRVRLFEPSGRLQDIGHGALNGKWPLLFDDLGEVSEGGVRELEPGILIAPHDGRDRG